MGASTEYFFRNVLHYLRDDCVLNQPKDTDEVRWSIWLCSFFVWGIIYLFVFKGIRSNQIASIVTLSMKAFLMILFLIRVLFLDGAGEGLDIFLTGEHNRNIGYRYENTQLYINAVAEVFFSLNLCLGIYTAFGSYNRKNKPVILDNFIIGVANMVANLILGFAVYSCVGYLRETNDPAALRAALYQLVFVSIPAVLGNMPGANFWSLVFFLMFFTIGIDTAAAMIEGISTVIHDTSVGKKLNRAVTTAGLCVTGFVFTLLYCADIGYILLDITDHYFGVYVLFLL